MLAAFGLASCQTPKHVPPPPVQQVTAPPEPAPPPAMKPPPPKPKPKPATAPPATTPTTPIVVAGLSRGELTRTLGEPAQRTERNPGQAWVYRAQGCSVEVLFLFDVVRNDMFAIDHKVTGTDGSARAEQQCLQRIKAGHAS